MIEELEIAEGDTRARVAPARGGMVTELEVGGVPIFFLDRATLLDPTKNVRGGSPVLFPTPGKLTGDAWSRAGRKGTLAQHGFARASAWSIEHREPGAIALGLEATDATRAAYPWGFRVGMEHRVIGRSLVTRTRVESRSDEAMPFGHGFHPYFAIGDRGSFAIETRATRAFDNVSKELVAMAPSRLVLGEREVDLHLLDHGSARIAFSVDGRAIAIECSADYAHWVIWSPPGRSFVCVEPWTCPGDAMSTGDRLIELAPGDTRTLEVAIRA